MTALTLTRDTTHAAVILEVSAAPRAAVNLAANPSVEVDTAGWSASGTGTTIARSTAQKDTGVASLLVTTGSGTTSGASVAVSPLIAGRTYGGRMRVRPSVTSDLRLTVQWMDASAAANGSSMATVLAAPAGVWTTLSLSAAAPAGTTQARLYVQRINSSTAGVLLYLDAAMVLEVEAGDTFDPAVFVETSRTGEVTITRTDANGTAPVRLREGQAPIAGYLLVQDYEAALTGAVTYQVLDAAGVTTSAATALALEGTRARIASVQLPSLAAVPDNVTGYEAAATSATVVHWPVDRGDPVVVSRPARTREGTLTLFAGSSADANAIAGVITPGRLLMLRQADHPGLDMYLVPIDTRVEPLELLAGGRWVWSVEARFVEVKAPAVPLLGAAGWTFEDITAGYATFSAVRSAFADFAALTIGPSS